MGEVSPKHKEYVGVDIPPAAVVLQRVATQVVGCKREIDDGIYHPVLVSLGPYHHGHPRLKKLEHLKSEILPLLLSDTQSSVLLRDIRNLSREIRAFYEDINHLSDEALSKMMLLDACFLIYCIQKMAAHYDHDDVLNRLGMSRLAVIVRDFFMWENQLPFFLLKIIIPFTCEGIDDKSVDAFFCRLVSSMINCGDSCTQNLPQVPEGKQVRHLLDACRAALVQEKETTEAETVKAVNSQFRSVTDLKAKGIHFRPTKSKSYCLTDIEFRSHSFYGMLRLPILLVDNKTNVILSNIIAMEMSAGSGTDFAVTSYVKFMKALIMKAEDVKELREKGIVVSCVANDEEVVKMFSALNTDGSCRKDVFRGVRERINEHCRSKTKTFKAELLHTYFRSPWTAIALFAAILILCVNCLNFLLNYYKFTLSTLKPA
ncbi:UPF0481 protein At3g47200-like [Salvia miltiorrhiza]|uniref:UPF0481 protein At3g47200-like n=1 Tax=Salvia miltiorrhiza TaxID=226208 RepID=UPI0025ABA152|nr:UPF0481 protein At3g47200-like [Salvia miltiorrhiza]